MLRCGPLHAFPFPWPSGVGHLKTPHLGLHVSKRSCLAAMGSLDGPITETAVSEEENPLLTPFQLGKFSLSHRIVLAPLTRCRSYNRIPQPSHASLYYSQRTTPGGLLISEATSISDDADGYPETPGVWTDEQVEAWKPIVKAVHDKGGIFFLQIWHTGRVSHTSYKPNGVAPVSSTDRAIVHGSVTLLNGDVVPCSKPRALETHEIPRYVDYYRHAARNAIRAGFDGVEIHGAHGYLIDQFIKDGVNDRTDEYGGSIENRARFALEVVKAVADEIGAYRTGIRLSLWTDYMDATETDPLSLGIHLAKELNKLNILYLHMVEPRMHSGLHEPVIQQSMRPVRDVWKGAFMSAGGHTLETGIQTVKSGDADLVVYGRLFLANPDLVERFRRHAPLNKYNRATFYTQDPVIGYTDYPFLDEQ